MAHSPRGWTGARTPSAIKRVRTTERRRAVNQPRRTEAKTLVVKALKVAMGTAEGDAAEALAGAISALDRAVKSGAIHPNAAARRKSRLALKVNAALSGEQVQTATKAKSTGRAAAAKAAKARVAAAKSVKAKTPQTAAGKARAALTKAGRAEAAPVRSCRGKGADPGRRRPRPPRATTKATAPKTAAAKPTAAKPAAAKTADRQGRAGQGHAGQGRAGQGGRPPRPRRPRSRPPKQHPSSSLP